GGLSDATIENGCLAVIPRSHDRVHPFDLVENPGQAHRRVARLREVDPSRAYSMELRAGEVAIFSANVVHGSAPNRSSATRVAILHDYTPAAGRAAGGCRTGDPL